MNSKSVENEGTSNNHFNLDDVPPKLLDVPISVPGVMQIDNSLNEDENIKNHDTKSCSALNLKCTDPENTITLISDLEEAAKELKYLENLLQETLITKDREAETESIATLTSLVADTQEEVNCKQNANLSQSTQTDIFNKCSTYSYEKEDSLCQKQSFELTAIDLRKKLENLESRLLKFKPLNEESESETHCADLVSKDEDIAEENSNEGFPLTRSPLLNTPPYETIIITDHNEARLRIYLNQRLHQCFLQEAALHEKVSTTIENSTNNNFHWDNNHLSNNSQTISSIASTTTLVHYFDHSEVDLEIKEIFTENPPVTHKIVRRKVRRERGSSVPAIDSFYGTKDIEKVGHASYFIPLLTPSERKCIGWRSEYHYGKWKYKLPIVPKTGSGVPLHPKKSLSVRYDGFSSIPDFGTLSECSSALIPPEASNKIEEDDCLSFITLSDSNRPSVTPKCHIIPQTLTVRKFVRWIAPCFFKERVNASASVVINERPEGVNESHQAIIEKNIFKVEEISDNCDKKKKLHHKHHHHIHFNIFGGHNRNRRSIGSETSSIVTGGDILLSNTESVTYANLDNLDHNPMDTTDTDAETENAMHITATNLFMSQYDRICNEDDTEKITKIVLYSKDVSVNSNLLPSEKSELKMDQKNLGTVVIQKPSKTFPYKDDAPRESPFLTREEMVFTDSGSDCSDDEYGDCRSNMPSVLSMMTHPHRLKILRSKGQHKIITLNSLEEDIQTHKQCDPPLQTESEILENGNRIIYDDTVCSDVQTPNSDKDNDNEEQEQTDLTNKLHEMHTFTQDHAAYLNFQSHHSKTKTQKHSLEIQETRFLDEKDLANASVKNPRQDQEHDSSTSFWNVSDEVSSIDTTITNGSEEIFSDTESSSSSSGPGPVFLVKGTKFVSPAMSVPLKLRRGSWLHQLISEHSSSSQQSNCLEENSTDFQNSNN